MDSTTPDAGSVNNRTFRIHLMKMGASRLIAGETPGRYIMEDTMMSVIMPGVSAMVGANLSDPTDDVDADLENRKPGIILATSVAQDVYDSLPFDERNVYGIACKRIDFGNDVVIDITVDLLAGMSEEDIVNLTEDEVNQIFGADEPLSDHDAKIVDELMNEWENETPTPIIHL